MAAGYRANIMHFARCLRVAGLPIGPGKVLQALEAVEAVGIDNRKDFYWTLHAVFVNRRDQRELFDQAFHVFWRNPDLLKRMMALLLPARRAELKQEGPEMSRRLADALQPNRPKPGEGAGEQQDQEIEIDASLTWSDRELIQPMDFEKMSAAEVAMAKSIIKRMSLPIMTVPTRRFELSHRGRRADLRATMRKTLRSGGDVIDLATKRRRERHPPLVVLCDISGSMSRYSRMLLHFMHAVTNDRDRVHTFLFGTRLTNVTRYLRYKRYRRGAGEGRGRCSGLVGRDAHRAQPARIQPGLVTPRIGPRRCRDTDHRRARPRCGGGLERGDRAAAQELPASDLAQSPLAL